MHIPRIYDDLSCYLKKNKALIIYGPRQVGKTTLVKRYLKTCGKAFRYETGDNIIAREILSNPDLNALREYLAGYDILVVDEAQKIPNIGEVFKLIIDNVENINLIATGSSSFELSGQVGEPLVGRKVTLNLFPVAVMELKSLYNQHELKQKVNELLIYGTYPEVITANNIKEKRAMVSEIMGSYLFKDILELEKIKNAKTILNLLRLLAFQVGNLVSLSELAQNLQIDRKTVARYVDLLEKSFVIYNLTGFSRNLRKEITKKSKYYFYDVGIRNAIISNFNEVKLRDDIGSLWENFIIIERIKKQHYEALYANNYFWRTWEQQEIDFIEERDGALFAHEIKWKQERHKVPENWALNYGDNNYTVINQENFLNFIG